MATFHKTSGMRMKEDSSSPYTSKELKQVEKKKGIKMPTMKAGKEPSAMAKAGAMAKRMAKKFRSPYSKSND